MFNLEGVAQIVITVAGVIVAFGVILKSSKGRLKKWLDVTTPEDVQVSVKAQLDMVIENQMVMNENILAVQHKANEAPEEMDPEVAAAWEIILAQMNQGDG